MAASGRNLANGRTTVMLISNPSAAQMTSTRGSAIQKDRPSSATKNHANIAPSPKKENWAKLTTFMTPNTREIPTAPRAYTFPRSRPAISVSNMIYRRTSAPQPLYSTHLPPVRMVGVSLGDATRRVVGSKVILPYTTLGTSLTCWKPLRMPSRVVPPCLAAATATFSACLLYTSDAADEEDSVDLGGRRIIKKKTKTKEQKQTHNTQIHTIKHKTTQ